jgi:hypothetical protein
MPIKQKLCTIQGNIHRACKVMHAIWPRCLLLIVISKGDTQITYELRLWMTNSLALRLSVSFAWGQQLIVLEHERYVAYQKKKGCQNTFWNMSHNLPELHYKEHNLLSSYINNCQFLCLLSQNCLEIGGHSYRRTSYAFEHAFILASL